MSTEAATAPIEARVVTIEVPALKAFGPEIPVPVIRDSQDRVLVFDRREGHRKNIKLIKEGFAPAKKAADAAHAEICALEKRALARDEQALAACDREMLRFDQEEKARAEAARREAERKRAEEEAKLRREAEEKARQAREAEQARLNAEAAQRRAEEEARRAEERQRRAEEDARNAKTAQAKAEAEAARMKAENEAREAAAAQAQAEEDAALFNQMAEEHAAESLATEQAAAIVATSPIMIEAVKGKGSSDKWEAVRNDEVQVFLDFAKAVESGKIPKAAILDCYAPKTAGWNALAKNWRDGLKDVLPSVRALNTGKIVGGK